jgi:hypothetical protein
LLASSRTPHSTLPGTPPGLSFSVPATISASGRSLQCAVNASYQYYFTNRSGTCVVSDAVNNQPTTCSANIFEINLHFLAASQHTFLRARVYILCDMVSSFIFAKIQQNCGEYFILNHAPLFSSHLFCCFSAPERNEVEVEMSVNGRSFTRSNFTVVLFYDCLVPMAPAAASLVALYVLLPLLLGARGHARVNHQHQPNIDHL